MDQQEAAWCREAHDRYDNYAMLARLFQREVDAELLADLEGKLRGGAHGR